MVRDAFLLDGLILILLWGAAGAAWNVAGGYAGQVSLGHAAFFGLGAYAAALLATRWDVSPWIGLVLGAALATAFGFVLGFLSNRLRGPYFVLATIAFSQVLLIVASRWRGFTSGSEGIPVPFRPGFWTLGITDKRVWVVHRPCARRRPVPGRACTSSARAAATSSRRCARTRTPRMSLGVPARRLKVAAIAVSAALTAVCGALWAQYVGFVDPFYVFSVDLSVRFALAAIIGGIGTALGPFLGAALITTLETYLRAKFGGIGAGLVGIYLIIYGTALIVLMRFAPAGPGALDRRAVAAARRRGGYTVSLLSVSGVTKRFGGITANRDISFEVARGRARRHHRPQRVRQVHALRGHQRLLPPRRGRRAPGRRPAHGPSPDHVCRLGVARTFQKLRPFSGLTVVDNVMVGALTRTRDVRHARARARDLLDRVGLGDKADAYARTLSTGQRKRLELARALATEPRVLLLDEVTGGVDQRSIPGLVQLVRDLHRGGLTLLVIEHNMRVITAVAQRIVALYLGEVIADGPPDAVTRDRRVVEAYLGQAYVQ